MIGIAVSRHESDITLKYNVNAFQLFIMGPNDYNIVEYDNHIFSTLIRNGIKLYAHAAYKTAISGPTTKLLIKQFDICKKYNFSGLVCHLQKKAPSDNAESIIRLVKETRGPTQFIFEVNGVKSDNHKVGVSYTFETPEKINYLINKISLSGITYNDTGFCIDTSHIWTGGVNLTNSRNMRYWLNTIINPKWIKLIHLNDSKSLIGGRDLHTWVGLGNIWPVYNTSSSIDLTNIELALDKVPIWNENDNISQTTLDNEWGYVELLRWSKRNGVNVILERHGKNTQSHISEINSLQKLWNKL